MANEITFATRIAWTRGGESVSLSASDTYTQIGNVAIANIQYVQGISLAIVFGNVLDPAFVGFRNEAAKLDKKVVSILTQIYLGITSPVTTGNATLVLDGGQGVCVPNGGIIWYALATASTWDPATSTLSAPIAGVNVPLAVVGIER